MVVLAWDTSSTEELLTWLIVPLKELCSSLIIALWRMICTVAYGSMFALPWRLLWFYSCVWFGISQWILYCRRLCITFHAASWKIAPKSYHIGVDLNHLIYWYVKITIYYVYTFYTGLEFCPYLLCKASPWLLKYSIVWYRSKCVRVFCLFSYINNQLITGPQIRSYMSYMFDLKFKKNQIYCIQQTIFRTERYSIINLKECWL